MVESNGRRTFVTSLHRVGVTYNNEWEAEFDTFNLYCGTDIRYAIQSIADGRKFFGDERFNIECDFLLKGMPDEMRAATVKAIKETNIMLDDTKYRTVYNELA